MKITEKCGPDPTYPVCSPSASMRQTEGLHGGRISGSSWPQGAKMKQKSGPDKAPAEQVLKNIRRQTRRKYSADAGYGYLEVRCLGCDASDRGARHPAKSKPVHEPLHALQGLLAAARLSLQVQQSGRRNFCERSAMTPVTVAAGRSCSGYTCRRSVVRSVLAVTFAAWASMAAAQAPSGGATSFSIWS
jgi:hypothetical protein